MIVTCEQCSTQFQLNDAKVPARGIRVRCSRCKHAFLVQPAGLSPADRIQQAAEEAISDAGSSVPGVTKDLPGGSEANDGGGEPDWQFNHDFGRSDDADEASGGRRVEARAAIDDLLGSGRDAGPTREFARDPVPDLAEGSTPELDDGSQLDLAYGPTPDLADRATSDSPPLSGMGETVAPEAASATALSDDDPASPDGSKPTPLVIGSVFSPLASTTPEDLEGGDATAARLAAASLDMDADSKATIWLRRIAGGCGWIAAVGLIGATLYGSLSPRAAESAATLLSQSFDGMEAESIEGRWIENMLAGPMYVVSGTLRGTGRGPVAARLEVRLLDERGKELDVRPAPMGPALAGRALREQDPAVLTEAHGRAAQRLTRVPLAPGARRRVQALFVDPPPAAVAFRLAEASPSSTGETP